MAKSKKLKKQKPFETQVVAKNENLAEIEESELEV